MRQGVNSAIAPNQPTYGLLLAQLPGETERRERETHRQIDMRESKNNRGGRCSKCIRKLEKERPPYSEWDLKIIGSTVGKHGDTEDLSTALDLGNI